MGANEKLLDHYVERYNARDLDTVMTLYSEDASQAMHDGTFVGRTAIRERLARDFVAFPDLHYTVDRFLDHGDDFADEWTIAGTHSGPFKLPDGSEIPPTGRRVEIKGMEFVRVRDGRIVIDNLYYDSVAILAQLGVVPAAVLASAR